LLCKCAATPPIHTRTTEHAGVAAVPLFLLGHALRQLRALPQCLWQQCKCCPATAPPVHFSRAMQVATACNNRFCANTSALQYTVHLRANRSQHAVRVVNGPSCRESAQCYVSHLWVSASKSCGSAPPTCVCLSLEAMHRIWQFHTTQDALTLTSWVAHSTFK
jgi:hypothetical protein